MIENLPMLTPDDSRCAITIARCHKQLAARRRRIEARNQSPRSQAFSPDRVLALSLCGAYLIVMAGDLLAIAALR